MHVRKAAATLALFASGLAFPALAADPAVYTGKAVVTAVGPKCATSVPAANDNVGSYYTIAYLTRPVQFTLNGHDWMQQFTDKTSKIFK